MRSGIYQYTLPFETTNLKKQCNSYYTSYAISYSN